MKKRVISLLLVFCMVVSLLPMNVLAEELKSTQTAPTGASFTDVKEGDWCYDAVEYVKANGIFNGTTPTTFNPNGGLTRGMFVAVLGRMAGVDVSKYGGATGFSDVPADKYYAPYVKWAAQYGITQGAGDGTIFAPNSLINRQQMAALFVRYFQAFGVDYETGANITTVPADLDAVAPYARESVLELWRNGLLNGDGVNFNPAANATRAQTATLSMRTDKAVETWYTEPGVASTRVPVEPETVQPADPNAPAEEQKPEQNQPNRPSRPGSSVTSYYQVQFALGSGQDWIDAKDVTASSTNVNWSKVVTLPETKTYAKDTAISDLPVPQQQNAAFLGWYYDEGMTRAVVPGDTVTANMTLYAKITELAPLSREETPNSASREIAAGAADEFTVSVTAESEAALRAALTITDVTGGNAKVGYVISGSAPSFTVTPKAIPGVGEGAANTAGLEEGKTYKLVLTTGAAVSFTGEAETVREMSVVTLKSAVQNLTLDGGVKLIPKSDVSGLSQDLQGLFEVSLQSGVAPIAEGGAPVGSSGQTTIERVAKTGTFTYNGDDLEVGDQVAIYQLPQGSSVTRSSIVPGETEFEYIAYVQITGINGNTYSYKTSDSEDVLFTPDVLPVNVAHDLNSEDGDVLTILKSNMVFTDSAYAQLGLDGSTTVDAGDFIAFYEGSMTTATTSTYVKITDVVDRGTTYTITYTASSQDEVLAAMDIYQKENKDITLTDDQAAQLEASIETQAIESGFVDEAAAYLTALALETDGFQELAADTDFDLKAYSIVNEDGTPVTDEQLSLMSGSKVETTTDVHVTVKAGTNALEHLKGEDGEGPSGSGVRVEMVMKLEITVGSGEKQFKIDMNAVFEQEVLLSLITSGGAVWEWAWIFPYIADYQLNASFEVGTYTGIGVTATAYTKDNSEEPDFKWEDVSTDDAFGAGTKVKDIGKQVTELMEKAEAAENKIDSFFNGAWSTNKDSEDEDAVTLPSGGLVDKYSSMLENAEDSWVDIVRQEIFAQEGFVDPLHILCYGISADFVVSANVYVTLGMTFTYEVAKQYNFSIGLFSQEATNEVVDLVESQYNFDFYVMGTMGVRAGIEFEIAVGLFSLKLDSVGITAEAGVYAQLWGFFYYHSSWSASEGRDESASGALSIELGAYLEITFKAQLFSSDKLKWEPTIYENQWPFLTIGDPYIVTDFSMPDLVDENGEDLPDINVAYAGGKWFQLPESIFEMNGMDLQTGEEFEARSFAPNFNEDGDGFHFTVKNDENFIFWPNHDLNGDGNWGWVQFVGTIPDDSETNSITGQITFSWDPGTFSFDTTDYSRTVELTWFGYPEGTRGITFDNRGAYEFTQPIQVQSGETFTVPSAPQKKGYTFAGWADKTTGEVVFGKDWEGTELHIDTYTSPHEPYIELYAIWAPKDDTPFMVRTYKENLNGTYQLVRSTRVVYDDEGNVVCDDNGDPVPFAGTTDSLVSQNVLFQRFVLETEYEGFTRNEEKSNYQGATIGADGNTIVEVYYDRNTYDLTFTYGQFGQDAADPRFHAPVTYEMKYGANISRPSFSVPGYSHNGWMELEIGTDWSATMPAHDLTYTARWTPVSNTVGFNSQGGSSVDFQTVETDTAATKPTDPTREGYTFGGWYIDKGCTKAWDFATPITGSITLYAKWSLMADIPYTVEHYEQKAAGSNEYTLIDTEQKYGAYNTQTQAVAKTIEGKRALDFEQKTINGSEIVIKIYYDFQRANLSFELNGGTADPNNSLPTGSKYYGQVVTLPVAGLIKEGCTFGGWYLDAALTRPVSGSSVTIGTEDITLYAKWNTTQYEITYYMGMNVEGAVNDSRNPVTYNKDTETFTLYAPSRTGYTFKGWTLNGSGETTPNPTVTINKGTTGDLHYTAHWTPVEYTVSLDLNGGIAGGQNPATYTITTQDFTLVNPTKVGHTFTGWTGSNGTVPETTVSIATGSTGDKAYTANWQANTYKVTFDANGGSGTMNSQTFTYGVSKALSANLFATPTAGYSFAGWATSKTGSVAYSNGATVTNLTAENNGVITLYAVWKPQQQTYTVRHYLESMPQSGSGDDDQVYHDGVFYDLVETESPSGTIGQQTAAKAKAYDGFTAQDFQQQTLAVPATPKDAIVVKIFYTRNAYTLTLRERGNLNNSSGGGTFSIKHGASLAAYANPTRLGHTFDRWEPALPETMPMNHLELTGQWTAIIYDITYDLAGGALVNGETNPATYTVKDTFTLNEPTKENYAFAGWTGSNGAEPQIDLTVPVGTTGDLEYTANWVTKKYTVTFDKNGKGTNESQTVSYNETVTPPERTWANLFTFGGWYTNAACTDGNEWNFSTPITGDMTLYAKWTATRYYLSYQKGIGPAYNAFKTEGGDDKAVVWQGGTYPELATGVSDGWTFEGWMLKESGTTTIKAGDTVDLTGADIYPNVNNVEVLWLYGKWSKSQYNYTFADMGTDAVYTDGSATAGTEITVHPGTRENYKFKGWLVTDSNGNKVEVAFTEEADGYYSFTMPSQSITVTAQWQGDSVNVTLNLGYYTGDFEYTKEYAQVTVGGTYAELPTPTRTGYTFAGWYTDSACTEGNEVPADTEVTITSPTTLYAKWAPGEVNYTVVHTLLGITSGTTETYKTETLTGQTDGDTEAKALEIFGFTPGTVTQQKILADGTTKVEICYSRNEYSVVYMSNAEEVEGLENAKTSVLFGGTLTEPRSNPGNGKDGKVFIGWYLDADFTDRWEFATDTVTEDVVKDGKVTLYAKWSDLNITFAGTQMQPGKYYDGGGIEHATAPDDGYLYLDGTTLTLHNFSNTITGSRILDIQTAMDLTLIVEGNNTLNCSSDSVYAGRGINGVEGVRLTIQGSGIDDTLTLKDSTGTAVVADALTIENVMVTLGNVSLSQSCTINGAAVNVGAMGVNSGNVKICGNSKVTGSSIVCTGDIEIVDSEVTLTISLDGQMLYANGGTVTIEGSTVTMTQELTTGLNYVFNGGTAISIKDSAVTVLGSMGILSKLCTIEDSTVDVTATSGYGIKIDGTMTITGSSDVDITANQGVGIYANALNIEGGTVDIKNSGGGIHCGVAGSVKISGGTVTISNVDAGVYATTSFGSPGTLTMTGGELIMTNVKTGIGSDDNTRYNIDMQGGTLTIQAEQYGIFGRATLTGGEVTIDATSKVSYHGGSVNATAYSYKLNKTDALTTVPDGTALDFADVVKYLYFKADTTTPN